MYVLRWDKENKTLGFIRKMRKEKIKSGGKVTMEDINKKEKQGKRKKIDKNVGLINKECKKNSGVKKRVIVKEDGRYLIFYNFD